MRRLILTFSIVLNLAFGAMILALAKKRELPHMVATPPESGAADRCSGRASTNHAPFVPIHANGFEWQTVASASYDEFVANLHAIGCPERTIRQIIVAQVGRDYARRKATLADAPGFWDAGPARIRATAALEGHQRALEAEQRALLLRLVNFDCLGEKQARGDGLIDQAILRFIFGPLPEDVTERVLAAMQKADAQVSQIERGANGLMLPEDEGQVAQCREHQIAELKQALTTSQFEEFTARSSGLNLMDHGMENVELSAREMRDIARLHATVFEMGQRPFDIFGSRDEPEEKAREFEAQLLGYLGETRFAQYKLGKNPAQSSAAQTAIAK
jgi:hypothetical protein